MAIKIDGYLTTKELMSYVKEKYKRNWGRFYVYLLKKKNKFKVEKLGHQNLYLIKDVDKYLYGKN